MAAFPTDWPQQSCDTQEHLCVICLHASTETDLGWMPAELLLSLYIDSGETVRTVCLVMRDIWTGMWQC